jgi:hypothetical protein
MLGQVNIGYAQHRIKISGSVVNEHLEAMPDVTLGIKKEIGTLTNKEGVFVLSFPDQLIKDSLQFSYVGYKTLTIALSDFKNDSKVQLQHIGRLVDVVFISIVDASVIISKAFSKVTLNYAAEPFEMVGFYRESGKLDSNYLIFNESSMDILNQGYKTVNKDDLIRINKERAIKKASGKDGDKQLSVSIRGGASQALGIDPLKNQEASLFAKKSFLQYDFEFSGSTDVNGEEAYVITFDQKDGIKKALYEGRIVVIKNSLAIVSLDYSLSPKGIMYAKPSIGFLGRAIMGLLGYHFKKLDEKVSLKYMKNGEKWYPYYYRIANSHHVKVNLKKIDGNLDFSAELFVSQLNKTPKHQYGKKEVISSNYIFEKTALDHTEGFWTGYAFVKPGKSGKDILPEFKVN